VAKHPDKGGVHGLYEITSIEGRNATACAGFGQAKGTMPRGSQPRSKAAARQ